MENKELLKKFIHREVLYQFKTPYDFYKTFNYDYKNACKWFKDYKKMPIKIAFELADYLNMRVVVFRDIR